MQGYRISVWGGDEINFSYWQWPRCLHVIVEVYQFKTTIIESHHAYKRCTVLYNQWESGTYWDQANWFIWRGNYPPLGKTWPGGQQTTRLQNVIHHLWNMFTCCAVSSWRESSLSSYCQHTTSGRRRIRPECRPIIETWTTNYGQWTLYCQESASTCPSLQPSYISQEHFRVDFDGGAPKRC